jgi:cysteinyl-tRNA synthetase
VLGLGIGEVLARATVLEERIAPLVEGELALRAPGAGEGLRDADAIRDRLAAAGVVVEDTPAGAVWYAAEALRHGA